MKAIYKLNDRFTFELEGEYAAEIVEQAAVVKGVFGDLTCTFDGITDDNPDHVEFLAREVDGDMFYELRYCGPKKELWGCQKKFSLRKKPKGHMYTRMVNMDTGEPLTENIYKNKGWTKYNKETGEIT